MRITITIDIDDETPQVSVVTNDSLTFERQAILDAIKLAGGKASPQQVSDLLNESHIQETNPAAVQTTMTRMVRRGLLSRVSRGVYEIREEV